MTLANYITIFRILLVPVFVGELLYYHKSGQEGAPNEEYRWIAAGIFLIAAISDAVDGYIARVFKQKSALGAVLDPLADKLLILSAIVVLSYIEVPDLLRLPLWFTVLVLSREVVLAIGIGLIYGMMRSVKIRPHWTGKISTFLLMVIPVVILFKILWMPFDWLVYVTAAFLYVSLIVYLLQGLRIAHVSGYGEARENS